MKLLETGEKHKDCICDTFIGDGFFDPYCPVCEKNPNDSISKGERKIIINRIVKYARSLNW